MWWAAASGECHGERVPGGGVPGRWSVAGITINMSQVVQGEAVLAAGLRRGGSGVSGPCRVGPDNKHKQHKRLCPVRSSGSACSAAAALAGSGRWLGGVAAVLLPWVRPGAWAVLIVGRPATAPHRCTALPPRPGSPQSRPSRPSRRAHLSPAPPARLTSVPASPSPPVGVTSVPPLRPSLQPNSPQSHTPTLPLPSPYPSRCSSASRPSHPDHLCVAPPRPAATCPSPT
ncbi:hypothetical protein E2C01_053456 [Portunus trituberculatus]|uniref:Uncharacterized protein n=1 Tax=Portunus trituberculatus TaxID=210409 RepID=A0A5B7GQC5_PORTR|nr:hypothetical protein [Portunus trituberculatus]